MATYATLTVPVKDIIGADFNQSRASVWIEPNVPVVLADSIRVGGRREQVVGGVATFTNLCTTDSADNPAIFGYRVTITAPPKGAQKREDIVTLTTSDFPFTATANLKDIDEAWDDIVLPASWRSDFRDEMQDLKDATAAIAGADTAGDLIAAVDLDAGSDFRQQQDARLLATYAPRTLIPASRAQAWGHSFMAGVGVGVDAATQGMAPLLAEDVALPLEQHAVGGTALFHHLSADANWTSILRDVDRPASTSAPLGGFYPVLYGMNDIAQLGLTATALRPFTHALRFAVSRFRSGGFFPKDDPTVALGGSGSWSSAANLPVTGVDVAYNATNGGTVTITTPADFPGGYVVPVFMTWGDGGATFTGSGDAAGKSINTLDFAASTVRTVGVLRVPADPGAGTYTWTTSANSGAIGAMFLGWQWEPTDTAGPLVALVDQPKPLDYTGYTGAPVTPTDASIDVLNGIQASLAAEFGPRVIAVDTGVMDKSGTYFVAGNVHPNAAGHAKLADLIADSVKRATAFVSAPLDVPAASAASGPAWQSYVPTIAGSGTAKGNGTTSGAYIENDNGTVDFYAQFILGSTSTIGTSPRIGLPVPGLSELAFVSLTAIAQDAGTGFRGLGCRMGTGATYVVPMVAPPGEDVTATTPFTWAVNDVIEVRGTYRPA